MKKRSDTKRSPAPPSLVYFVDRSLGRGPVAKAIRDAGFQVELMDDHFAQDADDADWIPVVAAHDWIIVTRDRRILFNPVERAALERSGAHYIAVVAKDQSGAQMGSAVGAWIGRINSTISAAGVPTWFRVRMNEAQILLKGNWSPLRVMHSNPKRWRTGRFK